MTVCYFIQSHRDPAQIERLVRTLRAGSASAEIVVQHNAAACALDWRPFAGLRGVHRMDVPWKQVRAHYSCQVEPYVYAIDWLDRRGIAYEWLVNLTAQDYPVRPVAAIEHDLETAEYDAFLRFWDVDAPDSPWSRRKPRARYWYRYSRWPESALPWLRACRVLTKVLPIHFYLDYGPWVGVRRWRTPFGADFHCYGGWAWFSLRREAALAVRAALAGDSALARYYRRCITAEESIVQTILVNGGQFRLCNDDRRYIDYRNAQRGSPRTLGVADLPLFRDGDYDFARKFDLAADPEVLDRIDRELLRA